MKKLFFKFVAALAVSLLLSVMFYRVGHYLSNTLNSVNLGGDKSGVFFVIFLGFPLGSLLGFSLIDKLLYKTKGKNILGLAIGLILSFIGAFIGILLLDAFSFFAVFLIPVIIIIGSLIGYQTGLLIIKAESNK